MLRRSKAKLLPHPVVTPVALPAGQPSLAELEIEPVLFIKQPAAADVAERQVDFLARTAADVIERSAECAGGAFLIHAEDQRRRVRQGRGERRRVGAADRRQLLRGDGQGARCDQQQGCGKSSHDAAFAGASASSPSRNGSTASMKACGWSMLTACP